MADCSPAALVSQETPLHRTENENTPPLPVGRELSAPKRKAKKSKWESDSGDEDDEGSTPRKKVKREKKKKDNRDTATKTGTTIAPTSSVLDIEDEGDGTETAVANAHDGQIVLISDDLPSEERPTTLLSPPPPPPPPRSPSPPTAPDYPTLSGCRSVEHYEKLNRIEEGAYGVVYRAREIATGTVVALKKLKLEKEKNGFPITSLREIHTLLLVAGHPNIVNVREIVVGGRLDSIYIVMDFIEHDLKSLMSNMPSPFLQSEVKTLLLQLLSACACLHTNWIVHRDLKTSNLLLNNRGEIKVADFGLARKFGSPLGHMTQLVVTLWYRAPELLLGAKEYSTEIDMWSVGCIFAELVNKEPLVPGKSEIDQLDKIFKLLGMPNERIWPGFSKLPNAQNTTFVSQPYNTLRSRFTYLTEAGLDLMTRLLTYDPKQRITAEQAMNHPYFSEAPLPKDPSMFPTWPSKGSGEKRKTFVSPSAPQATHAGGEEGGQEEDLYSLFNSETGGTGFRLKLGM